MNRQSGLVSIGRIAGLAVIVLLAALSIAGCQSGQTPLASEEFKKAVLDVQTTTQADMDRLSEEVIPETDSADTSDVELPGVGEIISGDSYDIAVAGGKFVRLGKSTYVALKVYVKSTGDYASYIEGDMTVADEFEDSNEMSDWALEKAHLQALDTLTYSLEDGQSTGGWAAFKVNPEAKELILSIGDVLDESDSPPISIPLAGFQHVSSTSEVAKLYAKAAKIGGRRVDAAELTMSEYKAIKNGMSLKRVNGIVGFKGDELSRYGSYVSYSWQNDDGGNMLVSFRSNRVYSKAQAGL